MKMIPEDKVTDAVEAAPQRYTERAETLEAENRHSKKKMYSCGVNADNNALFKLQY
jgi:hypothetical protein